MATATEMLTTQAIAEALTGQDATNGWDAAYAMNLKQVNALFLQQYLQNGPTNPAMPLRVILEVQASFWILDVVLGPPRLAFQAGSQTATLEMELVCGSLISFDARHQKIQNAALIRPNESKLTGPVALDKTQGEVKPPGNAVYADLGASAYSPSISGVDPKSVLSTEIGEAVRNYFKLNETRYPLGTIAPSNTPACLQPTDFHFVTQQKPGANDACVLLLIHTNGPAGQMGPLATYPIPDDASAVLIISGRVMFQGLLVDYLNQVFSSVGSHFSAPQSGAAWRVTSSGGTIDLGQIGRQGTDYNIVYSCDSGHREQPVRVACDGFTVEPSNGVLKASWERQWDQHWGKYEGMNPRLGPQYSVHNSTIHAHFLQNGTPVVDPVSAEVSFSGSPDYKVETPNTESWLAQVLLFKINVPDVYKNGIASRISPILSNLHLPSVNTFALTNLLFPAKHVVTMKKAAIPGDLYLTGALLQPINVSPVERVIAPGESVQFKAEGRNTGDVVWNIKPRIGSITGAGVYTAPKTIKQATVVVVTAVSKAEVGSAMVLIHDSPAKGGVMVGPSISCVTAGQSTELSTTDSSGNTVTVNWTLTPKLGEIAEDWGRYTYTAPASVESVTDIRITAVNTQHPDQHGEALIRLLPDAKVVVTPAQAQVKAGGTLELSAVVTGAAAEGLGWAVFPTGAGTVTQQDDRTKATYHAPANLPANRNVRVIAYTIDEGAGLGAASITLT